MQQRTITVTLKAGQSPTFQVQGMPGAACTNLNSVLEKLGTIAQQDLTEEYYQEEPEIELAVDQTVGS